jgi:antitoxin YqcF
MRISSARKEIARRAAAVFGGRPRVDRYWDEAERNSVDMLSCADSPCVGVNSYATLGVSESPLFSDGRELNVRAELVGACSSKWTEFPNYMATAAFSVIKDKMLVAPGIIVPHALAMYNASKTMKHFLLLPPFLWEGRLETIALEDRTVAWLLTVPISDQELRLANAESVAVLEEIFENKQIDIFDLARVSVV